jgi:general secretion pathway protein E
MLTGLNAAGSWFCGGIIEGALNGVTVGAALPYSPVKTTFFIGWFFLCLYAVKRSDNSPLIRDRYRYLSNIAALMIGPLHLFVLFIAETVEKLQDGELSLSDVPAYTLDCILEKPVRRKAISAHRERTIELLDTSGRSFDVVYAKEVRSEGVDRRIQERTEGMILEGVNSRASDILIDPKSDSEYTIRFRVDGFLRLFEVLESRDCNAMINSLKAIAGMDIAEKRRPQDGAFMAKMSDGEVYFRMATSGVLGGEKLAIRVMDQTRGVLELPQIGFDPGQVKMLTKIVQQPQGMILVCGPTGSGKTTTLYGMLQTIDFEQRNVITIEDPIEHIMPHISQIEVNSRANVTFAAALRSILRQDPDVICVGEIRDGETAQMAMQASQTGHLVLATLHANSNMSALVRLMDLGVKPLLISSAVSVIISQRLVRCLCQYCKGPAELTQSQLDYCEKNHVDKGHILQARGCGHCGGTGYYGRTAILDVMYMNDHLRTMLCNDRLTPGDVKKQGDKQFAGSLRSEGMKKVLDGVTTLSEVKRLTTNMG